MPFTHRITYSYADERSTLLNITENVTGTNAGVDISDVVQPNATNTYDVMIVPAKVQSLLLISDQPMTVSTNDQASPQDIINLKGNIPLIWTLNSWWTVPLKGDVSQLFLLNEGAVAANVQVRVLSN